MQNIVTSDNNISLTTIVSDVFTLFVHYIDEVRTYDNLRGIMWNL